MIAQARTPTPDTTNPNPGWTFVEAGTTKGLMPE